MGCHVFVHSSSSIPLYFDLIASMLDYTVTIASTGSTYPKANVSLTIFFER